MLVRPFLDNAVQLSSPYYILDIDKLETVQRRMTRIIQGIRNLTYKDRLKHFNLHSSERCRVREDLIEVITFFMSWPLLPVGYLLHGSDAL